MPAKADIQQSPKATMTHDRATSDFGDPGSSAFADDDSGGRGDKQHRRYPQPILPRISANFSLTFFVSSGLARATMGKSLSRSNGRHASMMARELVELALSSSGSSGPDHARRTNSMSLAGSQRVHIAHITSNRSVGSTSSSTTTTKRPR